jgi:hypothetical protein
MFWALQPNAAGAEPKVGVASAARNQVHGIIGGGTRALSAGSEVFSNEVVRTGDDSVAQLLFLDSTSLSVGARSEVKLDRFVYNPERKTGNVVLEASRGAFRFVSGSQAPTNYTIKTPLATIGVRGTIVDGYITYAVLPGEYVSRADLQTVRSVEIIVWQGNALVTPTLPNTSGKTYALGPGQALFISVNGQVYELQWDGTAFDHLYSTNFPLFGRQWDLDPRIIAPPDSQRDLNDELNAIDLRSLPLPQSCPVIGNLGKGRVGASVFCPPPGNGG